MPRPKKAENTKEETKTIDGKAEHVKTAKQNLITGTGRRKTAVARIFLYEKKGDFVINDVSIDSYFPTENEKMEWSKPFHAVGVSHPGAQFSGTVKVSGSGKNSQLGAVVLGFARALATLSEENRVSLRRAGLMTRDSRMVERKKPFLRKARKRKQYSKR